MPVFSVNFFWTGSFSWSAQWRTLSSPELARAALETQGPAASAVAATAPRSTMRRLQALAARLRLFRLVKRDLLRLIGQYRVRIDSAGGRVKVYSVEIS